MDKDLKLDIEEFNLDSEEIELLQNLENDYKPIANQEEAIERYSQIAKDNISKRRAINIKVLASDLEKIKGKAIEVGLPYQTLINSVIHQFATGKINSKII